MRQKKVKKTKHNLQKPLYNVSSYEKDLNHLCIIPKEFLHSQGKVQQIMTNSNLFNQENYFPFLMIFIAKFIKIVTLLIIKVFIVIKKISCFSFTQEMLIFFLLI